MIFSVLVDHDKEDIPTSSRVLSEKEQHGMCVYVCVCLCVCVCNTHWPLYLVDLFHCMLTQISNQPVTGQQLSAFRCGDSCQLSTDPSRLSVVQAGDGSVMVWGDILAHFGPFTTKWALFKHHSCCWLCPSLSDHSVPTFWWLLPAG